MITKPISTQGLILVGTKTESSQLLFYQNSTEQPCIEIALDTRLLVAPQINDILVDRFKIGSLDIEINMKIQESTPLGTLYVAFIENIDTDSGWVTYPNLLKSMPKDRSRVDYLRVWQHLCGSQMSQTHVKEVQDITEVLIGALPHDH